MYPAATTRKGVCECEWMEQRVGRKGGIGIRTGGETLSGAAGISKVTHCCCQFATSLPTVHESAAVGKLDTAYQVRMSREGRRREPGQIVKNRL